MGYHVAWDLPRPCRAVPCRAYRQTCSSRVSFESRKGTCFRFGSPSACQRNSAGHGMRCIARTRGAKRGRAVGRAPAHSDAVRQRRQRLVDRLHLDAGAPAPRSSRASERTRRNAGMKPPTRATGGPRRRVGRATFRATQHAHEAAPRGAARLADRIHLDAKHHSQPIAAAIAGGTTAGGTTKAQTGVGVGRGVRRRLAIVSVSYLQLPAAARGARRWQPALGAREVHKRELRGGAEQEPLVAARSRMRICTRCGLGYLTGAQDATGHHSALVGGQRDEGYRWGYGRARATGGSGRPLNAQLKDRVRPVRPLIVQRGTELQTKKQANPSATTCPVRAPADRSSAVGRCRLRAAAPCAAGCPAR